MILGSDKARLSKRHGATSVMAYRDMGYLPEALVNYLVRLGWSHGDQEIFSREELQSLFDLDAVGKSPAVFNPEKLLWLNQHYLRSYPAERLLEALEPLWPAASDPAQRDFARKVALDLQSRSRTLLELVEGAAFYFAGEVAYDPQAADKFLTAAAAGHLQAVLEELPKVEDYSKGGIEAFLRSLAETRGTKLKEIAQPLRVALTGKTVSPGIDEVMVTLGRERTLDRVARALSHIRSSSPS
jgi:glutamyl-tRNA synthetase